MQAQRQDWTAENDTGGWISLWREEMGVRDRVLWMKTRVRAEPLERREAKPGNRKRIRHLRRALDEFGGCVDVVIVSGTLGVNCGTAQPVDLRKGSVPERTARSRDFDTTIGHFEAALGLDERDAERSTNNQAPGQPGA